MDSRTHDTPLNIEAEGGEVHVDGPDGVVVSLTPEAAAKTSDRLLKAATDAQGQRILAEREAVDAEDRKRPPAD